MDSKHFITRDDPEHKLFEPLAIRATIARGVNSDEIRPDIAKKNDKFLGR